MGSRLLMSDQNMLNCILLKNRIIQMQYSSARVAKNILDTFIFKAINDDLSAAEFHFSSSKKLTEINPGIYRPLKKAAKSRIFKDRD